MSVATFTVFRNFFVLLDLSDELIQKMKYSPMKEFEKDIELPCIRATIIGLLLLRNKFQYFKGEWILLETKSCNWCGNIFNRHQDEIDDILN